MKMPFDMRFELNEDLREVPINALEFNQGIAFLKNKLKNASSSDKAMILSKLGVSLRIIGKLKASKTCLEKAITLTENRRVKFIAQLRLAQTKQFQKQFEEALLIYEKLAKICLNDSELGDLVDFVYQHLGKCHFDQQAFSNALIYFNKALKIRIKKGKTNLIDSTQLAINITHKRVVI